MECTRCSGTVFIEFIIYACNHALLYSLVIRIINRIMICVICLSNFPSDRRLYLCRKAKENIPLPRSDNFSVYEYDRGRVKPVCKTCSETGLGKQIIPILRDELRCNDIEPVVSKWRLVQRGCCEVIRVVWNCALSHVINFFKDETVKAVTEEQKKAIFSVLSGRDTFICPQTGYGKFLIYRVLR